MKPFFEQRQVDGTLAMSAMGAMITGGAVGPRRCFVQHAALDAALPQACRPGARGKGVPCGPCVELWTPTTATGGLTPPAPTIATLLRVASVAGGLSRTLAAVAACPFTIVKTRMEYSGAGVWRLMPLHTGQLFRLCDSEVSQRLPCTLPAHPHKSASGSALGFGLTGCLTR